MRAAVQEAVSTLAIAYEGCSGAPSIIPGLRGYLNLFKVVPAKIYLLEPSDNHKSCVFCNVLQLNCIEREINLRSVSR